MNSLLNIEKQDRILFKRHFIRNVILEFNFPNLKKDILLGNIENLNKSFSEIGFSRLIQMKQVEFKMTVDKDVPEQITHDKEVIGLLLFDDEKKIRIEILETKMIISIFKYLNFDNFISQVEKIISILHEFAPENNLVTKISLKKQNSIISTETKSFDDLTFILNEPLLSVMRTPIIPFSNFDFAQDEFRVIKDQYKCRIASDCRRRSEDEFEINLNILVVDNNQYDIGNIADKLRNLNNFNFSVFCWATTDKFKEVMNEEVT